VPFAIIDRRGAPQDKDAAPPEEGNGAGGSGPLDVPWGDDFEADGSEEDTKDSQKDDGSAEENESLEEDDEGDDEVDRRKSEVADLKVMLRDRNKERNTMCFDYVNLELKIRDLQSKLV